MQDCIFCKIIAKEIPSKIVYEDDEIFIFEDIHPQAPVHVLIIPRIHIGTLNDLNEEHSDLIGRLVLKAKEIAADKKIDDEGYRLVMNCNARAGQTVFHIHIHMLGGRFMSWPPG